MSAREDGMATFELRRGKARPGELAPRAIIVNGEQIGEWKVESYARSLTLCDRVGRRVLRDRHSISVSGAAVKRLQEITADVLPLLPSAAAVAARAKEEAGRKAKLERAHAKEAARERVCQSGPALLKALKALTFALRGDLAYAELNSATRDRIREADAVVAKAEAA